MDKWGIKRMIEQSKIGRNSKQVFLYLLDRADKKGRCFPGVSTIAQALSISKSTYQRAIRELIRLNLVRREYRYSKIDGSQRSNYFYINIELGNKIYSFSGDLSEQNTSKEETNKDIKDEPLVCPPDPQQENTPEKNDQLDEKNPKERKDVPNRFFEIGKKTKKNYIDLVVTPEELNQINTGDTLTGFKELEVRKRKLNDVEITGVVKISKIEPETGEVSFVNYYIASGVELPFKVGKSRRKQKMYYQYELERHVKFEESKIKPEELEKLTFHLQIE